MPVPNYSVLKGRPTAGQVVSGASAHYQITVAAPGGNTAAYTAAVNIQSVDGSEVLYAILPNFTPPHPAALLALPSGMTPLQSQPDGLALDFVRETITGQPNTPMITRQQMTLLPIAIAPAQFLHPTDVPTHPTRDDRAHALQNAVVALFNQAIADPDALVYAFGSAFADRGVTDGIHNLHMNQGNPKNNHGNDNGTWQDGAVFISLPAQNTWTALFLAFQTQSWTTDENGNPVGS